MTAVPRLMQQLLLLAIVLIQSPSASASRLFDVRDSVEMSYFGTLSSSVPILMADDAIVSPDGDHILKITHRGDIERGVTEGTLWMFDVERVLQSVKSRRSKPPPPAAILRMAAAANGLAGNFLDAGNVIFQPSWSSDSRTITFLGRNKGENRRLFQVDVETKIITALTPADRDVLAYASNGKEIAYLVGDNADLAQVWRSSGAEGDYKVAATGAPLMKLLYPSFNGNSFSEPLRVEVWRSRGTEQLPVIDPATKAPLVITTRYTSLVTALSPDGRRLVVAAQAGNNPGAPLSYQIIDVDRGVRTPLPLTLAPFRYGRTGSYLASWSPSGDALALSETVGGDASARCAVAIVKLQERPDTACVVPAASTSKELVFALQWQASDQIEIELKEFRAPSLKYRSLVRSNEQWLVRDKTSKQLALAVRESLNEPPKLFAIDLSTGRDRLLFDPNPQLAQLDMGVAKIFSWTDPRGRQLQGGLLLPSRLVRGKRYALVLQTHGFDPNQFFKVGYSETSNAGRALLRRDILVLQVKEPSPEGEDSWEDANRLGLEVYAAAIDKLYDEGLIDRTKVGITGYSYTGWLVTAALTRDPQRFSAAVIANTDPVTLTGYFSYVDTPLADAVANGFVGARPYGEGLKTWMDRVPSLASERIQSPVLFSVADPWHLIGVWDLYASLRDQKKPVELQYFRTGQHNLTKPDQRFAHQQMIVDWFDFWLEEHEDPDGTKAAQYARWRLLRPSSEH